MEVLIISTISGLATALGGILAVLYRKPTEKNLSLFLGAAAGVGITVAIFELLPSAVETGGYSLATLGFILGLLMVLSIDYLLPHIHLEKEYYICNAGLSHQNCELNNSTELVNTPRNSNSHFLKLAYLFSLGVILHNLPEGLAIGAGYEAVEKLGFLLALAVGIHNIPEGIALGYSFKMGGKGSWEIIGLTLLIGLTIPLGTLVSMMLIKVSATFISLLLSVGAGTLCYVITKELIPQSIKHHLNFARIGIGFGFVASLLLIYFEG